MAEVRARFGKPVIKVLPVSEAADLDRAAAYESVVDYLMFDAKPPKSMANALPGGNALSFNIRETFNAERKEKLTREDEVRLAESVVAPRLPKARPTFLIEKR